MTQKHTPPAYTFDGKGINDAADDYRTRIATLNPALNRDQMREHGALLGAAGELLAIARRIAEWEAAPDRFGGDLADVAVDARAAIAKAEGRS